MQPLTIWVLSNTNLIYYTKYHKCGPTCLPWFGKIESSVYILNVNQGTHYQTITIMEYKHMEEWSNNGNNDNKQLLYSFQNNWEWGKREIYLKNYDSYYVLYMFYSPKKIKKI